MKYDNRIPLSKDTILTVENANNCFTVVIDHKLATGGSCIVYNGSLQNYVGNIRADKHVIIKEFYPKRLDTNIVRNSDMELLIDDDNKVSFERELQSFCEGQANHIIYANENPDKSLPSVSFSGRALGTFYAVSDYGKGITLSEIDRDEYTIIDALRIVTSTCDAIEAVHNQVINHVVSHKLYLDCKPANIFINGLQAYLFDFNTSQPANRIRYCSYSEGWSAPEQELRSDGKGYVDDRLVSYHTDIFAIGAVLFWLLTGKCPSKEDLDTIQDSFDWKSRITLNDSTGAMKDEQFYSELDRVMRRVLQKDPKTRKEDFSDSNSATKVRRELEHLFNLAENTPYKTGFVDTKKSITDTKEDLENTIRNNSVKSFFFGNKKRIIVTVSVILLIAILIGAISVIGGKVTEQIIPSKNDTVIAMDMDSHVLLNLSNANHQYEVGLENWRRLDYNRAERDILAARNEISKEISQEVIDVAIVNNSLGCLYLDMGRYEDAYDYLNNSLASFRSAYGEEQVETLAVLYSMAQYDYYTGDVDTALKTLQRIIDKIDMEENKTVAVSVRLFQGMVYDELGNYDLAISSYKDTLALFDEISEDGTLISDFADYVNDPKLSEDDKDRNTTTVQWIIMTYNLLGEAYIHKEEYGPAQKVLELALDMSLDNIYIGKKNLNTSKVYMNLAKLYKEQNETKKALDSIDLAMRIQKNLFDYEGVYPGLVEVYDIYGELLLNSTDRDMSKQYFDDAYTLALESYGENHPKTAQARYYQGVYSYAERDYKGAENAFADAVEIRKNILGYSNVQTVIYLQNLSNAKFMLKDFDGAISTIEEAYDIAKELNLSGKLMDSISLQTEKMKSRTGSAACSKG